MLEKKILSCFFALSCLSILPVQGESFLEDGVLGSDAGDPAPSYRIGGYLRSSLFADEEGFKDRYAEGAVQLGISGNSYVSGFTELRYRLSADSEQEPELDLREAYLDVVAGACDLRVGQQIVVWGRADGFNPTNNLCPLDPTVFSLEEDDKRISNFILKGVYNFLPFRLEADWIPVGKTSVLPFESAVLPEGVVWSTAHTPDPEWENSSFAVKLDVEKSFLDASVSYYNGYGKYPGIRYRILDDEIAVYTDMFRTQVVGADFSATIGNYGLRGEFAYSGPFVGHDAVSAIPWDQMEYILGLDREWGYFSVVVQYIGKYVIDFEKDSTGNGLEEEIVEWNRMIFSQQDKWAHSVSLRPSLSLLHETVKCEMLGLINFTTKEVFVQPKIAISISDAFAMILGGQFFYGPDGTLYGYIDAGRNALMCELKLAF